MTQYHFGTGRTYFAVHTDYPYIRILPLQAMLAFWAIAYGTLGLLWLLH